MRSEETLRGSLLKRTPLGSSFEQVEAAVQREGLKNPHFYLNHGFYDQRSSPAKTVGKASIEATLGEHPWLLLGTEGAYAAWCFDEKYRLIEIIVYKEIDSL